MNFWDTNDILEDVRIFKLMRENVRWFKTFGHQMLMAELLKEEKSVRCFIQKMSDLLEEWGSGNRTATASDKELLGAVSGDLVDAEDVHRWLVNRIHEVWGMEVRSHG